MTNRITAIPLLIIMLIASIGMPVNVHSCAMADMIEVGPSCGMCAASHDTEGDNGCCDNETEIERSAPATAAKGALALDAPAVVAVISWPIFSFDPPAFGQIVTPPANGPPGGLHEPPARILFSSFLL